jgi:hypothetical protein
LIKKDLFENFPIMGQPLPLPERIPRPSDDILCEMNKFGISIHDDPTDGYEGRDLFVKYTLPAGWNMVNGSKTTSSIKYFIMDENNKAHFQITGAWGNFLGDELDIEIL